MPRRGVDLSLHDMRVSLVEAALARGGREAADAVEAAWRAGGAFSAWSDHFSESLWDEAFRSVGLPAPSEATPSFAPGGPLPWDHIESGVTRAYLLRERDRAYAGEITPDCTFAPCTGCGVCAGEVAIALASGGERRG
jgi:hypothetical protein